MRRREFITLLGGAAAAWPLAARAQQPAISLNRISGLRPRFCQASRVEALQGGLRDLGYVEGQNIVVRLPLGGRREQLPALAAELVR